MILTDCMETYIVWLHDFWLWIFWLKKIAIHYYHISFETHHFDVIKWSSTSIMINSNEFSNISLSSTTLLYLLSIAKQLLIFFLSSFIWYAIAFFYRKPFEYHWEFVHSCPMPIERNQITLIYSFFLCFLSINRSNKFVLVDSNNWWLGPYKTHPTDHLIHKSPLLICHTKAIKLMKRHEQNYIVCPINISIEK